MEAPIDIKILKKIASFPSISLDPKTCLIALRIIEEKLRSKGIPCSINKHQGSPFLIAGSTKKARALFLAHIDVVPGQQRQFKIITRKDRIVGRGVLDMKGPLVVLLEVFVNLWQSGKKEFLFAVTSDEEIGGFKGTAFLVKQWSRIRLAIVPDSTSGESLVICQKAPFHIKVIHCQGISSHASAPWKGKNSCEAVARCSLEIIKKVNQNHPEKTSATITQLHSGSTNNTIPYQGSAIIDIRIRNQKEIGPLAQQINQLVKKHDCQWRAIDKPLFFQISTKNKFLKKWISAFKKVAGKTPQLTVEPAASDARFLFQAGIPAIVTSVKGNGAHSEKEWVSKKSLQRFSQVLLRFSNSLRLPM